MKMKILVYPRNDNPYQSLLYGSINNDKYTIKYLENPTKSHSIGLLFLPFQVILYRLIGFTIFHIHFIYTFQIFSKYGFFRSYPMRLLYTCYFYFIVLLVRLFRYKIVWTAHDIIPHGTHFVNDIKASKFLASIANAVIVHATSSINLLKKLDIRAKKIEVIPIGTYSSLYKNKATRIESRRKLNIDTKVFMFAHFGRVEYYKGTTELVEAFNKLNIKDAILLISGPCQDTKLRKNLEAESAKNKNIILDLRYIPDNEVQYYMNSADVFVFPFREITTSSSVLLAMSFKKAVIAPIKGDIVDIPRSLGYFYNSGEDEFNSLKSKMLNSYENRDETIKYGLESYKFITEESWDKITKKTELLYEEL